MHAFIQNYIHNLQYAAASLAHPFEDKTKIKFTPGTWKTAFFNYRNKYECGCNDFHDENTQTTRFNELI